MKEWDYVLGVIDSYGAIHFKKFQSDGIAKLHTDYWPTAKKRWRFNISDWQLKGSPLAETSLTKEEVEDVLALMGRVCQKPKWLIEGEAWEAAGRPRGRKHNAWLKKRV